ncbi:hypothetical protein EDEG_00763 [Edhazardia aedis USNM 41457]|uniref:mannose-1-phosphate guanylyltransferase n=1 Tax=Edhazardia aedis (strain USNM 41457) TaxID=1003232 RepID=J9DV40_EDHAE|nr:hypothetical protein EDEG_00763 [Edhazardia aedis USNM 41457]|eukprot:EJW05152.1 hypothetical protein EDEG_00763 [Edhazardia aedis USNM 41457]
MEIRGIPSSALILVGGYGTRLRPFTLTISKPLVPFANKPILFHQIDYLYKIGVHRIILATCSREKETDSIIIESFRDYKSLEIIFSYEDSPLGTAGPLYLARDLLTYPCFVLNSDVICNYPLEDMLYFHQLKGCEATILSTFVKEPSKYGVMVRRTDELSHLVEKFVEKPKDFVGNSINAGIYILEKSVIEKIPGPNIECSIENEIFPALAYRNTLAVFDLYGYWMDIGQPKDYLEGLSLYISNGIHSLDPKTVAENYIYRSFGSEFYNDKIITHENYLKEEKISNINFYNISKLNDADIFSNNMIDNSIIHKTVKMGHGCKIGPNVVIGENVKIGDCVRLRDCAIFSNTILSDGVFVNKSIIGWDSVIKRWARLDEFCFLGSKVTVESCVSIKNCTILPYKKISTNSDNMIII